MGLFTDIEMFCIDSKSMKPVNCLKKARECNAACEMETVKLDAAIYMLQTISFDTIK